MSYTAHPARYLLTFLMVFPFSPSHAQFATLTDLDAQTNAINIDSLENENFNESLHGLLSKYTESPRDRTRVKQIIDEISLLQNSESRLTPEQGLNVYLADGALHYGGWITLAASGGLLVKRKLCQRNLLAATVGGSALGAAMGYADFREDSTKPRRINAAALLHVVQANLACQAQNKTRQAHPAEISELLAHWPLLAWLPIKERPFQTLLSQFPKSPTWQSLIASLEKCETIALSIGDPQEATKFTTP